MKGRAPCIQNECCRVQDCIKVYLNDPLASLYILNKSCLTRKRAREEEIEAAEKAKREREWQKNFEVSFALLIHTGDIELIFVFSIISS